MPPRKRQREQQQEGDPAPAPQRQAADAADQGDGGGGGGGGAAAPPADRRAGMAEIARRRAAHFANFQEEAELDEANVHAGGTTARALGPWSSAVELVNEREKAQERRRARIQEGRRNNPAGPNDEEDGEEGEDAGGAEGGSGGRGRVGAWRPSRNPSLGPRVTCPVPALRALCVSVLVQYADCLESLAGVPDAMRSTLAVACCARRALTPEVALVFARDGPSELLLPDCTQLDKAHMVELVQEAATTRLERLELGMCGRGFGDASQKRATGAAGAAGAAPEVEAAEALARAAAQCPGGVLPALRRLKLGGAYRLNTQGLAQVLRVAPHLTHLSVPDCLRLTPALVHQLPQLTPHLTHLDLAECRGLDAPCLSACLPQLASLVSLTLDGILEVDNGVLSSLGQQAGGGGGEEGGAGAAQGSNRRALRHLSLCRCPKVTDGGLQALAAGVPQLETLRANMCDKVTDEGLQALAAGCPSLKVLSVQKLPRLTDAGLVSVAQCGALESLCLHSAHSVTDDSVRALAARCHATLTHLDVSFCRRLTPDALGALVDACKGLTSLVVFGCSQLNNKFAHGHSNDDLATSGGLVGLGTAVTTAA